MASQGQRTDLGDRRQLRPIPARPVAQGIHRAGPSVLLGAVEGTTDPVQVLHDQGRYLRQTPHVQSVCGVEGG
jgi:hypothetical protein